MPERIVSEKPRRSRPTMGSPLRAGRFSAATSSLVLDVALRLRRRPRSSSRSKIASARCSPYSAEAPYASEQFFEHPDGRSTGLASRHTATQVPFGPLTPGPWPTTGYRQSVVSVFPRAFQRSPFRGRVINPMGKLVGDLPDTAVPASMPATQPKAEEENHSCLLATFS